LLVDGAPAADGAPLIARLRYKQSVNSNFKGR